MLLLVFLFGICLAQQKSVTDPLVYNARTPFTVPQQMFEFMEKYHWGDFHLVFHMNRHYYTLGQSGRQWLDSIGEKPAPYQEGDPNNGVEFLAMHRAMLEYLSQRFGSLPVNNDPENRRTIREVLLGWSTDSAAEAGLRTHNGDAARFKNGLTNINNFGQFTTEDEFGRFIQTTLRLQGTVDRNNPSARRYTYDQRPGSGVHNWMHGQLQDDSSPITVGDPRTNLPNILFWRIHGWIEAKWKEWEAARPRTTSESQLYEGFITQFRAHMISMSEQGALPTTTVSSAWSSASTTSTTTTRTTTTTTTRAPTTSRTTSRRTTSRTTWSWPSSTSRTTSRTTWSWPSSSRRTTTTRRFTSSPSWFGLGTGRGLQGVREDIRKAEDRVEQQMDELNTLLHQVVKGNHIQNVLERVRKSLHSTHMHMRTLRVPWQLVHRIRHRLFRNHVPECRFLSQGVYVPNCPNSKDTPTTTSAAPTTTVKPTEEPVEYESQEAEESEEVEVDDSKVETDY